MTHTIENEFLQVSVNDHGAELCSIFDKEKNREVIWQADPAFWKRHAPVFFPNVGRHYLDHFRTLGKDSLPNSTALPGTVSLSVLAGPKILSPMC